MLNRRLIAQYEKVAGLLKKLSWAPPLMIRLFMGTLFLLTGHGKLTHLPDVIKYFTELGIPLAQIQAPFVACVEFFGGACLLVGLATRWVALPLAGTMVVALITAKSDAFQSYDDFMGTAEVLYLLLLVALMGLGGGWLSADHFLSRKLPKTPSETHEENQRKAVG